MNSPDNHRGKVVWGWFTNMVFLKKYMRQVNDPSFYVQKIRVSRGVGSSLGKNLGGMGQDGIYIYTTTNS